MNANMSYTDADHIAEQLARQEFETTIRVKSHGAGGDTPVLPPTNVHGLERLASFIVGIALLLGIGRRFVTFASLTMLASYLVYRGVGGHCLLYDAGKIDTAHGTFGSALASKSRAKSEPAARPRDKVEQGSWESFPASDPPATSSPVS